MTKIKKTKVTTWDETSPPAPPPTSHTAFWATYNTKRRHINNDIVDAIKEGMIVLYIRKSSSQTMRSLLKGYYESFGYTVKFPSLSKFMIISWR